MRQQERLGKALTLTKVEYFHTGEQLTLRESPFLIPWIRNEGKFLIPLQPFLSCIPRLSFSTGSAKCIWYLLGATLQIELIWPKNGFMAHENPTVAWLVQEQDQEFLSEFPGGRGGQGEEMAPRGSGILGMSTLGSSDISVCSFGLGSDKKP